MSPAEALAKKIGANPKPTTPAGRKVVWKCRLLEKRIALGLVLRDVERGSGVSSAVLSVVEHGADTTLTTALRISKFFGCTVEEMWPEKIS